MKPLLRGSALVLAAAVCVLSGSPGVRAQVPGIGYWVFEDVRTPEPFGCGAPHNLPSTHIAGFGFDPQGRPVLAWREENGCGGGPRPFWARKEGGTWNTTEIDPGLNYPGGADSDYAHVMKLNPVTGDPHMFFSAISGENFYAWRVNLAEDPTASSALTRLEFLNYYRNCIDSRYSLAFAPGQSGPPSWISSHMSCPGYGPLNLNGAEIDPMVVRMYGHDLAVTADGTHHIVYNAYGTHYYRRGTETPRVIFSFNSNGAVGGPQIEAGADGTLHAVYPGYGSSGDLGSGGALVYTTSSDGGDTWSPFEVVDEIPGDTLTPNGRVPRLTFDRNGNPALAYWSSWITLRYATRASGAWQKSDVTTVWPDSFLGTELAFDEANTPTIALYDPIAKRVRLARPAPPGTEVPVDLSVSGSDSVDPVPEGQSIGYTLTAANVGPRNAPDATLTVTLPPGATLTSSSVPPTSSSGGVLTFDLGGFNSGATWQVSLTTTSGPAGNAVLTAAVTGSLPDADPTNDSASVTTRVLATSCFLSDAGLTVWWTGDGTPQPQVGAGWWWAMRYAGRAAYEPGVMGQAFSLNGSTDSLASDQIFGTEFYPGSASLTLAAWVRTSRVGAWQFVAGQYECGGSCPGNAASAYTLYVDPSGRLSGSLRDVSWSSTSATSARFVADGAWHHIALVRDVDAGELRLYVDGAVDAVQSLAGGASGPIRGEDGSTDPFFIGAVAPFGSNTPGDHFQGAIDDVRLYYRALGADELAAGATAPQRRECGAPNGPPAIDNPGDQTNLEGDSVSLQLNATDPDGDPLVYSADGLPPGLTLDPSSGLITGTLPYDAAGTYSVSVSASDGSTSASATFTWTVLDVNRAPAAGADAATTPEDTAVRIDVLANDGDADGDALAIVGTSAPAHGSVSVGADGSITYAPEPNYVGPDAFTYTIGDDRGGVSTAQVTLTVTPANDPPSLTPPPDQTNAEGDSVSLAVTASDPDGDSLTYAASGLPPGIGIDPATGAIGGTLTAASSGSYLVNVSVDDGHGGTASGTFQWTVTETAIENRAPVCDAAASPASLWPPNHKQKVIVGIQGVVDPDGDPISLAVTRILQDEPTNTLGDGETWIDGGGIGTPQAWVRAERTGTPRVPGNGRVYEIQFSASDGRGGTCSGTVFVGVPHDQGKGPAVDDGIRYDSTVAGGPRVR